MDRPPYSPLKLVVLCSGQGTTLKNLLEKIAAGTLDAHIQKVIASSPHAGALKHAQAASVPTAVFDPREYRGQDRFSAAIFAECREAAPHLVVLGGFLKKLTIPADFDLKVMNIHPALIPAFCGRGLYGRYVHEAVLDYGCHITGCTVHFVDNQYDHGPIVLQRAVPVLGDDTPATLAARVFEEECKAYPEALTLYAQGRLHVEGRRVRVQP
jgi:phosphoribosylglycinamide formyltransferase-1